MSMFDSLAPLAEEYGKKRENARYWDEAESSVPDADRASSDIPKMAHVAREFRDEAAVALADAVLDVMKGVAP